MIEIKDIIKYSNCFCDKELLNLIEKIYINTQNSWQKNRSLEEIKKDTMVGKISEYILKKHIENNSDKFVLDYDNFRIDNFKKAAPLDCIFYKKDNNNIFKAIDKINNDVKNNNFGKISQDTKIFLKENEINTLEIKTTRITLRHYDNNGNINFNTILNDDFLAYPKYKRTLYKNLIINNWNDYLNLLNSINIFSKSLNVTELKEIEKENMTDFYARVYVKELEFNKFDIYLIGYISKNNLIEMGNIKRMPKFNKSENALYIAAPLKMGNGFKKKYENKELDFNNDYNVN